MSNGKFNYLPTQSPLNKATPKPKPATTPPTKAKEKTKSPYTVLMGKVEMAKSKATAIRKNKKQKSNNNGTKFLQNTPSTTAAVHNRLGTPSATAVPARH